MDVVDEIRKYFSPDRFTGEVKVYKTTEAVRAMAHWGEWEAIREFIQNALDEMTPEVSVSRRVKQPKPYEDFGLIRKLDGIYIWDRGKGVKILDILITGRTGKVELKPTRGEFGEGIKKAVQTLLSLGRRVTFYTRNGYKVEAVKTFIEEEGERFPVVGYKVEKYNVDGFSYGTVVHIDTPHMFRLADFTVLDPTYRKKVIERIIDETILVTPECYEKLPEKIKWQMRTNEIPEYVPEEIKKAIREKCGDYESNIVYVDVFNEIINNAGGPLAYRDIIIRQNLGSKFAYNIWSSIPVDVMGRDRKIISNDWLFRKVGEMYERIISDYASMKIENFPPLYVESREPKDWLVKEILGICIFGSFEFESHIYLSRYVSEAMREYLTNIVKDILKTNLFVFITASTYNFYSHIRKIGELLKYEGYEVVVIPDNFSMLTELIPLNKIGEQKEKLELRKKIIPDEKLDREQVEVLNILRWIVNKLYEEEKSKLFEIYNKYLEYAKRQHSEDFNIKFRINPPKIMAADLSEVTPPESGRKCYGRTYLDKNVEADILIEASILRFSGIHKALGTLTHELAHYVTLLTDANMEILREAIEDIAGLMEWMLIKEINKIIK